jgi:hypothetical protein
MFQLPGIIIVRGLRLTGTTGIVMPTRSNKIPSSFFNLLKATGANMHITTGLWNAQTYDLLLSWYVVGFLLIDVAMTHRSKSKRNPYQEHCRREPLQL